MKMNIRFFSKAIISVALLALLLVAPGFSTQASTTNAAAKKVDITVVVHGKISGHTAKEIEELIAHWLEEAHFVVVNTDGVDVLELEVTINVDDDDDDDDGVKDSADDDDEGDGDGDGKGFHIDTDCGSFDFDEDVDVVDAIDEALHHMVDAFIKEFHD